MILLIALLMLGVIVAMVWMSAIAIAVREKRWSEVFGLAWVLTIFVLVVLSVVTPGHPTVHR